MVGGGPECFLRSTADFVPGVQEQTLPYGGTRGRPRRTQRLRINYSRSGRRISFTSVIP